MVPCAIFVVPKKCLPTGQRGPFSKPVVFKSADETAKTCERLWPLGPPNLNDPWNASPGTTSEDYVKVLNSIFSRTIPMPIKSRWYDINGSVYYKLYLFVVDS